MSWPWVAAFGVLWALVLVLALLVLGLLRRGIPLLMRVEQLLDTTASSPDIGGLAPGEFVAAFRLVDGAGEVLRSGGSLERPALFLFVEGGCEPCRTLARDLAERDLSFDGTPAYLIFSGQLDKDVDEALRGRGLRVFKQYDHEASRAFKQVATPHAFVVDSDWRVVEASIVNSADELGRLADVTDMRREANGSLENRSGPSSWRVNDA